jgi:hypothetical protein
LWEHVVQARHGVFLGRYDVCVMECSMSVVRPRPINKRPPYFVIASPWSRVLGKSPPHLLDTVFTLSIMYIYIYNWILIDATLLLFYICVFVALCSSCFLSLTRSTEPLTLYFAPSTSDQTTSFPSEFLLSSVQSVSYC